MNMDIKRLIYFLEIAKTLNITKAAENLHMSQPPLTYQLRLLEEELETQLFVRTTRSMEITPAGEKLKLRAEQIIDLLDTTRKEVMLKEESLKELSIGFVASSAALLSPEKLIDFHNLHNNITFNMKEGDTHKILDLLNHGLIDIGLVRTPFNGEKYYIEYLDLEPMIAVYDKRVYEFNPLIQLSELKDIPLLLDKRFMDLIVETAHKEGFGPKIICKGEDSRSLLAWAKAGLGLAVLPESGKAFLDQNNLTYATINSDALKTRPAIVMLKNKVSPIYKDLIEVIK